MTLKGWQNFVRRVYFVDSEGREVRDDQGRPIEEDFAKFPFYWRKEHYSMATSEFVYKLGELTAEERLDYKKLVEFVEGIPPYVLEDPDGEPLLGEDGQRVTSTKLIGTRELIACDTPEILTAFW
ncbi:hypothetical protein L195_g060136, partial [Trifolium pratense]